MLPWLIPAWWRDLKARQNAPLLVLGGWVLLVLLFFSMSSGKRSVYIFPAAPAFAMIVAAYASTLVTRVGVRRTLVGLAVFLGVLVGAFGLFALMNPQEIREHVPDAAAAFKLSASLLGIGIAMTLAAVLFAWRRPILSIAAALALLWIGISVLIAPVISDIRSGKLIMREVAAAVPPSTPLALVDWPEQFILAIDARGRKRYVTPSHGCAPTKSVAS